MGSEMCIRDSSSCAFLAPSQQSEPAIQLDPPDRAFQHTAADLFAYAGSHFLVYTDHLTGWTEITSWRRDPSTSDVVQAFRRWFTALGVPALLFSDNGPQFASSDFADFAANWGFRLRHSSPRYPQANGLAESAVKRMKHLVATTSADLQSEVFQKALLEYRNTPLSLIHI